MIRHEHISRIGLSKRTRRATLLVLTMSGAALGVISLVSGRPALVANYSPSIPQGLYFVEERPWRRWDTVAVAPSPELRAILRTFGVLPDNRLLVKVVAATGGDLICRDAADVTINHRTAVTARSETADQRPLPSWQGCITLSHEQVLLLGEHPGSFDGRYFGPTRAADIIGALRPLWTVTPRPAEAG